MSALVDILRVGGGDDFLAVRAYTDVDGSPLCDLFNEMDSSFYTGCPVLTGLGTTVPAPNTVWDGRTVSGLPRVFAVYRSSRGGTPRAPVVVGVINNEYTKKLTPRQQESADEQEQDRPESSVQGERVQDAGIRTAKAAVYARASGAVDTVAETRATTTAPRIILGDGRSALDRPALATALSEALDPLYTAVNELIIFCQNLAVPAPAGGVTIITIPTPAGPIDVGKATIPYTGAPAVDVPPPDLYESPVVQIASQE